MCGVRLRGDSISDSAADSVVRMLADANVRGAVNLLQSVKAAWHDAGMRTSKADNKHLRVPTYGAYGVLGAQGRFAQTRRWHCAAVFRFQGGRRPLCDGLSRHFKYYGTMYHDR